MLDPINGAKVQIAKVSATLDTDEREAYESTPTLGKLVPWRTSQLESDCDERR